MSGGQPVEKGGGGGGGGWALLELTDVLNGSGRECGWGNFKMA